MADDKRHDKSPLARTSRPAKTWRRPAWPAVLAVSLLAAACNGRPLLYQIAPSDSDLEALAAFQMIDTAKTGQLTRKQVDDYFRRRFTELDRNKDGYLDAIEAQAALPLLGMTSGASMIFRLDMNGDGKVSVDEFVALSNTLFLRDADRDGVLTLVEVKTPPVDSYVPVSAQKNSDRESVSTR